MSRHHAPATAAELDAIGQPPPGVDGHDPDDEDDATDARAIALYWAGAITDGERQKMNRETDDDIADRAIAENLPAPTTRRVLAPRSRP